MYQSKPSSRTIQHPQSNVTLDTDTGKEDPAGKSQSVPGAFGTGGPSGKQSNPKLVDPKAVRWSRNLQDSMWLA